MNGIMPLIINYPELHLYLTCFSSIVLNLAMVQFLIGR